MEIRNKQILTVMTVILIVIAIIIITSIVFNLIPPTTTGTPGG